MQQHDVEIVRTDTIGVDSKGRCWDGAPRWYVTCHTCGHSGSLRRHLVVAEAEAALHERTA